ncbi:MAG: ABC transporter permease subunit [Pseudomonadales bacterium]
MSRTATETSPELPPLPTRRRLVNTLTAQVVGLGGIAVIGAIILIFVYLLGVVAPMFGGASIAAGPEAQFAAEPVRQVDMNETGEVALRLLGSGAVEVFDPGTGAVLQRVPLTESVRSSQTVQADEPLYALLTDTGVLHIAAVNYRVGFVNDVRQLSTRVEFAFADEGIELGDSVRAYDVAYNDETLTVAYLDGDRLRFKVYRDAELGYELDSSRNSAIRLRASYQSVYFGPRQQSVYLVSADGDLEVLGIRNLRKPTPQFVGKLAADDKSMTAFAPLLGRYSWLVATADGELVQRFLVRGDSGYELKSVRSYSLPAAVLRIFPEPRRKGFAVLDAQGQLHLGYSTTGKILASFDLGDFPVAAAAIDPRSTALLLAADDGRARTLELDNKHPEISWGTLWSKVWYEGYPEPVYSWQSSSADNDFEPKFSLTPLLFGTIKAAAYALLFAVPIAIMGALYTAYFMAAPMRALVKPGIEIMAALPTVILGFLAGLWLAPMIESNLAAVLSIVVVTPLGILLLSWLWNLLPNEATARFDGWYGLVVMVPMLLIGFAAFAVGPYVETAMFGGDAKAWFAEYMGLTYDQRNALVVGIAMGLAVIPTIFSIAEDAIYGVPNHLINGSLALGATPWQTLTRVVLLTASPGIFSAVMIGMGRAVGETMIVLMATGNTPVMDWNIFQGMRTFAANIAVELPESEVASTHYRILFLAALVLFFITFAFNTIAEVVRQRLRARYGSL